MVGLTTYSTPLPVDVALTEHSRKFYDGTYKWDSEGFTDDNGVYREFNCYDPAARAPTPLPPMCLSDDEADGGVVGQKLEDNASSFTFASGVKSRDVVVTVRRDELFRGHADRERLIGKVEDALISSKANRVNLTLEECYRLCVTADHVQKVDKLSNQGQTPEKNTKSPSELSDCPSDISEWDVKTTTKKPIDEMFEQDDVDEPKRKPTTRGVAQKVKKGVKKLTIASIKSSPMTKSLQTGSYIRGTGETSRRRSTRLSNAQSGK